VKLPADHIERHSPAYLAELRHFVQSIRAGEPPAVGAADAQAALVLALAAERSARERLACV
jgi:myo-inositol 2-dehydrogenase/D-chiro-inositol 1-dehydrogenase